MRTISAALTAAQKAASRDPYITAAVRNDIECVRRLDFTVLNDTFNTVGKHDIAVTADGAAHRVRNDSGTIKYQRLVTADQDTPANWDLWTDLITGVGSGPVAVAASGTRVLVVYASSGGTQSRYKESTDSGASFGADTALQNHALTINDLACAYKNDAGDCCVLVATAAATLNAKERVAGAFGSNINSGVIAATITGVAVTYAFDYELLATGTETTTLKPTVWSGHYQEAANAFSGLLPQFQADAGVTGFQAPFLTFLDTWRATFVELPAFSGGITRAWRTYLHPLETWNRIAFLMRTPLPTDNHVSQGLAVAHGGDPDVFFESGIDRVSRAPTALVSLDIAQDIQQLEIVESTLDTHGFIDLVNPDDPVSRRYASASGGPPAPIKLGNMVRLAFGYRTPNVTEPPTQLLATTHSASPRTSTRLLAGAWGALKTMTGVTNDNPRPFALGGALVMVTNGAGTPARSTDYGDTWSAMPSAIDGALWFCADANGRCWTVRNISGQVFAILFSDNSGAGWTLSATVGSGGDPRQALAIAAHPTNPNIVAVIGSSFIPGHSGLCVASANATLGASATWSQHTGSDKPRIGQVPRYDVYGFQITHSGRFIASGPLASGSPIPWSVRTSDDSGATFTTRYSEPSNSIEFEGLGVSITNKVVLLRKNTAPTPDSATPLVSTDGGDTFTVLAPAQTMQDFVGSATANSQAIAYDPELDAMHVATDRAGFAVVTFSPVTNAGVWSNQHDAIPSSSFGQGNLAVLLGVADGGGPESSGIQDLWITAIEHRRTMRDTARGSAAGGRAVLRLYLEGGLRRLRRHHQPASIAHTADDYRQIISAIMSRAGLSLSVTNASSRSDSVVPRFTIDPDHTAHQAMTRALAYLTDRIFMGAASTAHMKQLVSGEAADYSLANEYPDDPTEHPIYALRLRSAPPPAGAVYVASLTTAPAFLSGEAVDHETADLGLAPLARLRDFSSDAISEADATADAHILQLRFGRDDGTITCPPILGLELLDTIEFDDPYAQPPPSPNASATSPGAIEDPPWRTGGAFPEPCTSRRYRSVLRATRTIVREASNDASNTGDPQWHPQSVR
jgi:hypothetical protein